MTTTAATQPVVVDEGTLTFTIESRLIRELGERLVKQPEVALVELVKNAYDADATVCRVRLDEGNAIVVADDGRGMTLAEFIAGWMRIGTSAKEAQRLSPKFDRLITGEKGIGRFAVRFLGRELHLESTAEDRERGLRTLLRAHFDWPAFDNTEDLGQVRVPYSLTRAAANAATGTELRITKLRPTTRDIDLDAVRTATMSVVTPYRALLRTPRKKTGRADPGFVLETTAASDQAPVEVGEAILANAVLKAVVSLEGDRLDLRVYGRDADRPLLTIKDDYPSSVGPLHADIRFFPQRKGTFVGLPVDGRAAKTWVKDHGGIAVFDRSFRVLPYGTRSDDWLSLAADSVRRTRTPRSSLADKHFPMDEPTRQSTQLNYMLRLPYPEQLVGVVQVEGRRVRESARGDEGLIAAADREGFVDNAAFRQLWDVVRGAVEAIAHADRELQLEQQRQEQQAVLAALRKETRAAIREIEANTHIRRAEKERIIRRLAETEALAERHEETTREQRAALATMSLLGVIAGFMTHEFGAALDALEKASSRLDTLAKQHTDLRGSRDALQQHLSALREFVTYSQAFVRGAGSTPERPYLVRPRLRQVVRVFERYAADRSIKVEMEADAELSAPPVPVSLYSGVVANLFTNALKAVTARSGGPRAIALRAWNEPRWHRLEVSDTGVGIPNVLRERVFDPLFTTTAGNRDPLGSGMGLGLALVKRGVETFGGRVEVVDPPAGFSTCVSVRLPLTEK